MWHYNNKTILRNQLLYTQHIGVVPKYTENYTLSKYNAVYQKLFCFWDAEWIIDNGQSIRSLIIMVARDVTIVSYTKNGNFKIEN